MIQKKDIFIGFFIGFLTAFIGTFVVLYLFTNQGLVEGFSNMKKAGMIGKVITLGCIPNLILFFILLKKNKDLMARGVILSMFLLVILTVIL
ncbi:conserved membrane hypothetical protein [Flavobacterium sp. 9AF]|uniref:hypothetical protein n=1 Tax=Flavobacterium sp. 9AF TaxID=2653142 RepID=UPI0012F138CA|nr:hypothetical protein [Flavobacterium sp. 9AF]VXC01055.1 conserved membrane hypothetical protein [Flavobacterium sp. 9AF]